MALSKCGFISENKEKGSGVLLFINYIEKHTIKVMLK